MFPDEAKYFFIGATIISLILIGVIGWAIIEVIRYLIA